MKKSELKKSQLKQIIRECIIELNENSQCLKEKNNEIDLKKPYAVVRSGGPIGKNNDKYIPKYKGVIVDTFDDINDAKNYAKRRRARLSTGEKKYYKMTYRAVKL